ncbi:hypothetical protein NPIL_426471 [Nephila pilipes]|uniref:Uncharacterized protein n=1 Tax=Nephila pilipes TaxID=299642 RepID=A0A8X6Q7Z8_NEPPI|nr:hypothetical protein NPIL_426471 [Nephila pilipes]
MDEGTQAMDEEDWSDMDDGNSSETDDDQPVDEKIQKFFEDDQKFFEDDPTENKKIPLLDKETQTFEKDSTGSKNLVIKESDVFVSIPANEIELETIEVETERSCINEELQSIFPGICKKKLDILKKLDQLLNQVGKQDLQKCIQKLVEAEQLNYMIINLYSFLKGYEIIIFNHEKVLEKSYGIHSYADTLLNHIDNGLIPYEILDKLLYCKIPIFYEGYLFIKLRSFVARYKDFGFYILQHSNKTINGMCDMIAFKMSYNSKEKEKVKSRLLLELFPTLCLSPKFETNYSTFDVVSPHMKRFMNNEMKERIKFLKVITKPAKKRNKRKSITHKDLLKYLRGIVTEEIVQLPKEGSKENACDEELEKNKDGEGYEDIWDGIESEKSGDNEKSEESLVDEEIVHFADIDFLPSKLSKKMNEKVKRGISLLNIVSTLQDYIRKRQICIPYKGTHIGSHVEIESFIFEISYEYKGKIELEREILRVAVPDGRDRMYFCAYESNGKFSDCPFMPWFEVGNQNQLNVFIKTYAKELVKKSAGYIKVTHVQNFIQLKLNEDKKISFKYEPRSEIIVSTDLYPEHHDDFSDQGTIRRGSDLGASRHDSGPGASRHGRGGGPLLAVVPAMETGTLHMAGIRTPGGTGSLHGWDL